MGEELSAELEIRAVWDQVVYIADFQVNIVKHL